MDTSTEPPSTPKDRMQKRAFTLPPRLDVQQALNTSDTDAESIETLYVHPHTSIIKFTSQATHGGKLPWTAPLETTIAAGALELYRVPNSVSFLRSGNFLHAIMPRSQCWCVDGVSKFAMRVLPDTYYRVELPGKTKEDLELVEAFKAVLGKVMHYERTACPFARESDEELPELEDLKNRRLRPGDSPQWLLDRSRLRKTAAVNVSSPKQEKSSPERIVLRKRADIMADVSEAIAEGRAEESYRSVTAPPAMVIKPLDQSLRSPFEVAPKVPDLRPFQAIPTDMPPSPPDSSAGLEREAEMLQDTVADLDIRDQDAMPSSAAELETLEPGMLPRPDADDQSREADTLEGDAATAENDDANVLASIVAKEESSDVDVLRQTIVAELAEAMHATEEEVVDALPEDLDSSVLIHEIEESLSAAEAREVPVAKNPAAKTVLHQSTSNPEDPFAAIQARILARRSIGGTTLFIPSAVRQSTSFSASSVSSSSSSLSHSSNIAQQRSLAKQLVRKACSAFIGPPAHLATLMLKIAARFANGTFGNMFFVESPSGVPRRIPGSFDINDEISSAESLSDDEDDFGVPLHSPVRLTAAKHLRERIHGRTADAG